MLNRSQAIDAYASADKAPLKSLKYIWFTSVNNDAFIKTGVLKVQLRISFNNFITFFQIIRSPNNSQVPRNV